MPEETAKKEDREIKDLEDVKPDKAKKSSKEEKSVKPFAKIEKSEHARQAEPANFDWKKATKFERIAFAVSMVAVVAALVFVILEFNTDYYAWASDWFRVCFGVSFLAETVCYWKIKRSMAIVTLVIGALMLAFGVLGIAGVGTF